MRAPTASSSSGLTPPAQRDLAVLKLNLALHVEDERIGYRRRRRSLGRPTGRRGLTDTENERRGRYLNELIYSAAVRVGCASVSQGTLCGSDAITGRQTVAWYSYSCVRSTGSDAFLHCCCCREPLRDITVV